MDEIWKDVLGFEGLYQVSNYGRIKSFKKYSDGYILSNTNAKGDYLRRVLSRDNYEVTKLIHRLVYETFIGEIPNNYQIDHIDSNKQNNNLKNLQCLSRRDHVMKTINDNPNAIRNMNLSNIFRSKEVEQYSLDGNFIQSFFSSKIASEKTGVCERNIHQVANKDEYKPGLTRKQAGGFVWKYKTEKI